MAHGGSNPPFRTISILRPGICSDPTALVAAYADATARGQEAAGFFSSKATISGLEHAGVAALVPGDLVLAVSVVGNAREERLEQRPPGR